MLLLRSQYGLNEDMHFAYDFILILHLDIRKTFCNCISIQGNVVYDYRTMLVIMCTGLCQTNASYRHSKGYQTTERQTQQTLSGSSVAQQMLAGVAVVVLDYVTSRLDFIIAIFGGVAPDSIHFSQDLFVFDHITKPSTDFQ